MVCTKNFLPNDFHKRDGSIKDGDDIIDDCTTSPYSDPRNNDHMKVNDGAGGSNRSGKSI